MKMQTEVGCRRVLFVLRDGKEMVGLEGIFLGLRGIGTHQHCH